MNQSEDQKSNSVEPGHPLFCVVIPTYNNGETLADVINGVLQHAHDVIVVNDGSDDHTRDILLNFPQIHVVSYEKNRGKGYALKLGFKKALELGFEYAITIDSDGQHNPDDIVSFIDTMKREGKSLIVGARSLKGLENVPSRNSFANRFSNFWFHLQTGIRLDDTQSGFRLYPLSLFEKRKYVSRKYEFELEVMVRAAWSGMNIISIPVKVYYAPGNERVSHFRPFRDFGRISILNFFLTFLAIAYFRPVMIIRKFRKKKLREIIREDLFSGKYSNRKIAVSVGFGVFMGILPIWGYQLVVGFIIAHFLKMSKTIFFLAANISLPPMLPFILYLSYVTGSLVMGDFSWKVDFDLTLTSIKQNLVQYLVGSVILAVVAGLFFGFLASFFVPFIRKRKRT